MDFTKILQLKDLNKEFLKVEEKAVFDFRNWLFIATLAKFRQFLKEFRALLVNKTECVV